MTENHQNTFHAAEVIAEFENIANNFNKLLIQENDNELCSVILAKLNRELEIYRSEGIISVALIGQYSAGKSTIISALTGKRDIKIDADIATEQATTYLWNGIKITDTPGLFTDRKDHDNITYEALTKSDLLVFCLTSMLFDTITVKNFKKLAFEKGYRWKIMLVVNKMSDEAGDDDEKIKNYSQSLAEAIKPHKLGEFNVCFIDAKDYCDGIDENDDFLIEISRFPTLIETLNQFVSNRRTLAHLDTPIRIFLEAVDNTEIVLRRDQAEDATFFEVLNRLSRTINLERSRFRTQIKNIILELVSAVTNEGANIACRLDSDTLEVLQQQTQVNLSTYCEKASNQIEMVIRESIYSIQSETEKVLTGDLVEALIKRLQLQYQFSIENPNSRIDVNQLQNQIKFLSEIGEKVGLSPIQLATRGGWHNTHQGGSLRSIDVVGSDLHHFIRGAGEFIGYKFRPWEAVNLTKNIANFAGVIGGVLGVVAVATEIMAIKKEKEEEQKLAEARMDITSQFIKMANELKSQIEQQTEEVESQLYYSLEKKISEIRKQQENAIHGSNNSITELSKIRHELNELLLHIKKHA